ncbi:PREDICTED: mitochondrial carrier homolog 2 [Tinamus guttatus]|uniref:mitochondrial carrier homolog 2 n=1 Tax=Tinamus guttatus TaxID=94827 RepID=UPI00052E8D42|nr:PREDICTED: mitochondrial carrier homolog 2 [Tinamus guttatus]
MEREPPVAQEKLGHCGEPSSPMGQPHLTVVSCGRSKREISMAAAWLGRKRAAENPALPEMNWQVEAPNTFWPSKATDESTEFGIFLFPSERTDFLLTIINGITDPRLLNTEVVEHVVEAVLRDPGSELGGMGISNNYTVETAFRSSTLARHIVKVDGRAGLFKGLTPRLCSGAIGTIVHSKVLQRYQEAEQAELGASKKEPVSSLEQVLKETSREMVARSAATLITHPFHGRSGTLSAFTTIYREEGVLGFFAGLIPRLLGDILSLWLCNMLAYLINTYALDNGVSTMAEMKSYSQAVTGFFASMLTYPFVLVSNLMAINNCGLAGCLLPYAPTYSSWLDCWSQLHKEGNMSRGNSLFFRKVPTGKRYVWEERRFR